MKRPNLFKYATSELSQDAFIAWLASWAHPDLMHSHAYLYQIAHDFIVDLCENKIPQVKKLKVETQQSNIDVLITVNEEYAILIEDKVHTKQHSDQLERYKAQINQHFHIDKIYPIYFKTGDQSSYEAIEEKGYMVYNRERFLKLLRKGKNLGVSNPIYIDYLSYLEDLEKQIHAYKKIPVAEWHNHKHIWKGVFIALQKQLNQGNWSYVPQKNGGFYAFYWRRRESAVNGHRFSYYLQLEESKFCFKISPEKEENRREVRSAFRDSLFLIAQKHHLSLKRNGRIGRFMTVAIVEGFSLPTDIDGRINLDQTATQIEMVEQMMKTLDEELESS